MESIILFIGMLALPSIAFTMVSIAFGNHFETNIKNKLSGFEVARKILDNNDLKNMYIVEIKGNLNDHYDYNQKVIRLSSDVYHGISIASVSVACHECGHAIQDKENYLFLRIRSKLVPLVNFSSYAGYVAIALGCLFGSLNLIWIGIIAEFVILLFQLITLPVEIDASKRAMKELDYSHFFNSDELKQGKIMLMSAALTYVASVVTTLIQILRLILMFERRED